MRRRDLINPAAWTAALTAFGVTAKQLSDVVKDQREVWGNVGWAAEEVTLIKERLDALERKAAGA